MVTMLTYVYIPIKWLERRVARKNMTWRRFIYGKREGTGVVKRYRAKSFMFRLKCFVVNILGHNITITLVGRNQGILENAED